MKPLQGNLDFFLIRASRGPFRLKHKTQGPPHIHIPTTLNASKCLYNSQPKPCEDLPCVTIVHQGQKQRGRESLPMRRQTSGVAGTQIRSFEANEQSAIKERDAVC